MDTRPATPEDSEFVYQVKVDALKDYIEQTWGWDESFQRAFHADWFDHKGTEIIQYKGEDAGFLMIAEEENQMKLNEINLLTRFQNKGIGSSIIEELQNHASRNNIPIWLQVLKVNPAITLYLRLGFVVTSETDTHFQMHWTKPVEA